MWRGGDRITGASVTCAPGQRGGKLCLRKLVSNVALKKQKVQKKIDTSDAKLAPQI